MPYVKPLTLYKELLKWKSSKPGRLLCLDLNEKYVDLAVTDPENIVAVPLSCLHRQENDLDLIADKLQTLICKHNLIGFVVGYPYLRTIPNASMVNTFVDDLYKTGKFEGFNYTFWDEQFASKLMQFQWKHHVEFFIEHMNLPQHISKQIIDRFIAVRILQGYMKSMPGQLWCLKPRSGVLGDNMTFRQ